MKLSTRLLGAAVLVGLVGATANAQISISRHNFSTTGWAGGEICKPCHTPHFANAEVGRLWNHALTTATYTMHGGTGTAEGNFDTVSRMCLSCHDGTVALDSFGGTTGTNFIGTVADLGTDLEDDHPVGSDAEYPPNPKPSWWDGSMNPTNATGTSVGSLRLKAWDDNGTVKQTVGCTTCHNAHNKGNYGHMTAISNAASAMCLTCHIK
jgi:hypothetical protein